MVLTASGIYGVLLYLVVQRTREIGVRMALGASPGEVIRMVLGQSLRLVAAGLAAGAALAWLASTAIMATPAVSAPAASSTSSSRPLMQRASRSYSRCACLRRRCRVRAPPYRFDRDVGRSEDNRATSLKAPWSAGTKLLSLVKALDPHSFVAAVRAVVFGIAEEAGHPIRWDPDPAEAPRIGRARAHDRDHRNLAEQDLGDALDRLEELAKAATAGSG